MRALALQLGAARLYCDVAQTEQEQRLGLQGRAELTDGQGMYFPYSPPARLAVFRMGAVAFPLDMVFFQNGRVAQIVANVPPGHPGRWTVEECSGVLELRGGWAWRHGLRIGTPLIVS